VRTSVGLLRVLLVVISLVLFFLLLPITPRTEADGGAPNLAYVSGTSGNISIVDIAQRRLTGTLSVPANPVMILLSIDGHLLYATQPGLDRVMVINTTSRKAQCSTTVSGQPTFLAIDPWTNTLYAAGTSSNQITALDPTTCAVRYRVRVQGSVTGLAIAIMGNNITGGDENQLWIAGTSGISIFHINGKPLAMIPLTSYPRFLCIPTGFTAYVSTQRGDIEAIDLKTHRVSLPLLIGGKFGSMDYDAITGNIYVPDLEHKRIDVLGPVVINNTSLLREPLYTLSFSSAPQSVAITSDGQFGFIALEDGNVVMLDIPGHQVITMIHVGGHPHFIITGLYPLLLSLTPRQASLLDILLNALHYAAAAIIAMTAIIAIAVQKYRERRHSRDVLMPGIKNRRTLSGQKEITDEN
jgi:DNA-binding beta-propeller fold protein YncE